MQLIYSGIINGITSGHWQENLSHIFEIIQIKHTKKYTKKLIENLGDFFHFIHYLISLFNLLGFKVCVFFILIKELGHKTIYFFFHQDMFSCTSIPFSQFKPVLSSVTNY